MPSDEETTNLAKAIWNYFPLLVEENKTLKQELQRKDNNWNELKEFILNHYIVGHKVQNSSLDMIINKIKELESK